MGEDASVTEDATTGQAVVHYWAAARAAAGIEQEQVPAPVTLAELIGTIVARHPDRPRLRDVISVCSVLVGDRPVSTSDPSTVTVKPGDTVELLPPFAGG
jgi:molybdopterin synthase sulfur carrier subunit